MAQTAPSLSSTEIAEIRDRLDRPIVLVGLMGVGKSSVGKRVAHFMDRDFCDADSEIELAAQRSVAEIFEEYGEQYFRDGERRVIARLIEEKRGVIATGGGAFLDAETRALILGEAVAVWIDCDIDTLVERTSRRDTRPLLKNGDPRAILTRLEKERGPIYAEAQIRVESMDGPHDDTAMRILEGLKQWL
jgi:shikimate kinase